MTKFTDLEDEDVSQIMNAFSLGNLRSLVGIADGEHETTYLFHTDTGQFIVTLFETEVEPLDLERAFHIMSRLGAAGVPCPKPVRDANGAASIWVSGKLVATVTCLDGVITASASAERSAELGKWAARIHRLLPSRPFDDGSTLPRGFVHGALKKSNVFFIGNKITGIINFRMAHEDFFVSELADIAVNWLMDPAGAIELNCVKALLSAYDETRTLSPDEWDALPGFVMSSAARHLASINVGLIPAAPIQALGEFEKLVHQMHGPSQRR